MWNPVPFAPPTCFFFATKHHKSTQFQCNAILIRMILDNSEFLLSKDDYVFIFLHIQGKRTHYIFWKNRLRPSVNCLCDAV